MAFMNVRAFAPITALAWLALAGVAHGQTQEPSPVDIRVLLPSGNTYRESNEQDRIDFFNYAHCQCAYEELAPDDPESSGIFKVELRLLDFGYQFMSDSAKLVVGTSCDDDDLENRNCVEIATIPDVTVDLRDAPEFEIRSNDFMFPREDGCDPEDNEADGVSNVWLTFDAENDGRIDSSITADYPFDAEPPPLPANIRATPGEDAINVRWDPLESQQSEVYGFQVLCGKADGSPAFATPKDEPEYDTPFLLCGSTTPQDLFPDPGNTPGVDAGPGEEPDAGAGPDAGTVRAADLPDWMANLDQRYICGWAGSTEKSLRITGLENGVAYRVALLSVDDARNVVGRDLGEVTPQAVTDFWEDYHDQGGSADGGICLVTSTFGDGSGMTQALRDFRDRTLAASSVGRMLIETYYDYVAPLGVHAERSVAIRAVAVAILAPLAGLAAFWEYTSLPVKLLVLLGLVLLRRAWRRRRAAPAAAARITVLRPALAAAAVLVACAWAAPAAAQTDPYWEDFGTEVYVERPEVAVSYWNAGIKIGPYTPDVDTEFMTSPGPYERMYGGAAIMGLIDVERFFLFPLGQVGIAGSLGYAQKTANAFATCPANDPDCMPDTRADGDKTSFRLVPMALSAVYRFTLLDDQWKVPLVPYARAGLSYYLWWITAPDGSLSEIEGDRALGASLGWQGSVGLAVRAERLDPQSARSLRNDLGIEHAGFYGELMYADVGGFGAEGKLQVGALTWFAGLNFEF
jgi:hypothetical protein